jgi:uncharacterized metal-binding protein YceD (DUF177 family)
MTEAVANELSRIVSLANIGNAEWANKIEVTADERVALARRFGLQLLDRMTASVTIRRLDDGAVRLRVAFDADVVQHCVATLEPVESRVEGEEDLLLVPPGTALLEVVVDPTDDEPEPLLGEVLDIGEVVAEQFGLALDPYPRKTGIEFQADTTRPNDGDNRGSPFEVLRGLSARRQGASGG